MPGLVALMRDLAGRKVRLVEVETAKPSPFARSLLFGYVGAFLYEGDAPLAERRAAALALDSTLLGELLGRVDLRELLDPAVVALTEARLQWLTEDRRPRDAEDAAELLRQLGDLSTVEAAERGIDPAWLAELERARRAIQVRIGGVERFIAIEDAGRLRDALGVALPVGLAAAFVEPGPDPLGDLVGRYARTHGPFTAAQCAGRFGLGVFVVEQALRRLAAPGRVTSGEFTPDTAGGQWCDTEVLRLLRRRSLAALRAEIEPAPPAALARFLPAWQHVGGAGRGVAAVIAAIEQLQGVPLPASALERLILPARVADYSPAYLDEVCASGDVLWAGAGAIAGGDGWVTLAFADTAPLLLAPAGDSLATTPLHEAILEALADGQALFFRALSAHLDGVGEAEVVAALWDLVWAGLVSNDTLAPLRTLLAGAGAHKAKPSPARTRYRQPARPGSLAAARTGPPTVAGRWSRLPERDTDPTRRAAALTEALLDRHGVLTRGAVAAEGVVGGYAGVYPVLAAFEERGAARRGYFVEGLGAAQFAVPGAVDRLRALADRAERGGRDSDAVTGGALVLAATDPANPYGAALPWPDRVVDSGEGPGSPGPAAAGATGQPGAGPAWGAAGSTSARAGGPTGSGAGGPTGSGSGAAAGAGGDAVEPARRAGHRAGAQGRGAGGAGGWRVDAVRRAWRAHPAVLCGRSAAAGTGCQGAGRGGTQRGARSAGGGAGRRRLGPAQRAGRSTVGRRFPGHAPGSAAAGMTTSATGLRAGDVTGKVRMTVTRGAI